MKNLKVIVSLHPFNETAIDNLLINVPEFANGNTPDNINLNQKRQVYSQIKQMNHVGSNKTYNSFFEAHVTNLN
jgi:hypothetical protein